MDASSVIYIYGLREPDTGLIRYIGKTIRPEARLRDHINDRSVCHRTNWIKSLKARGIEPEMVIIEEIRGAWPWQEEERFWIEFARRNDWPLVNSTSGGDGVCDLPAESRQRMAATWKGRKHTPEAIAKMRAALTGKRHSQQTRERMSKAHAGRVVTWGDKLSAALRKLTAEQVSEIGQRLRNGEMTTRLAAEYGVHRTTISKIKMGTYYDKYRARQ